MKKSILCITMLVSLMVVGGCASSTRNEPNMSRDGVGISNQGDGAELYGNIRVGVSGRL